MSLRVGTAQEHRSMRKHKPERSQVSEQPHHHLCVHTVMVKVIREDGFSECLEPPTSTQPVTQEPSGPSPPQSTSGMSPPLRSLSQMLAPSLALPPHLNVPLMMPEYQSVPRPSLEQFLKFRLLWTSLTSPSRHRKLPGGAVSSAHIRMLLASPQCPLVSLLSSQHGVLQWCLFVVKLGTDTCGGSQHLLVICAPPPASA